MDQLDLQILEFPSSRNFNPLKISQLYVRAELERKKMNSVQANPKKCLKNFKLNREKLN